MRKFLILLFAALIICLPAIPKVSAEQAAADHYRQLINSGKFFIEYGAKSYKNGNSKLTDDDDVQQIVWDRRLAYSGNEKKIYGRKCDRHLDIMKYPFNPKMWVSYGKEFVPVASYQNGKYYQFYGKNEAIVGDESEFSADYINPKEDWQYVSLYLQPPKFFVALSPNAETVNKYFGDNAEITSEFVDSGTEKLFGQELKYDAYLVKSKNADSDETYTLYYDANGILKYVKEDVTYQVFIQKWRENSHL